MTSTGVNSAFLEEICEREKSSISDIFEINSEVSIVDQMRNVERLKYLLRLQSRVGK